uniref:Uncharacterized protein n=1 Tax=Sphaerodactylus townsendi TaxID=933632 RepID=A0ACB8G5I9_9SAUR
MSSPAAVVPSPATRGGQTGPCCKQEKARLMNAGMSSSREDGGRGASAVVRRSEATEGVAQREEEQEEDGEEDLRDGGVPFFVNRGGLPIDVPTWERMWKHVAKIHPDGEKVALKIRGATDLPKIQTNLLPSRQLQDPKTQQLLALHSSEVVDYVSHRCFEISYSAI